MDYSDNNRKMIKTDIYDLGYIYFSVGKDFEKFMNRDIDNKLSGNYFLGGCDFFLRLFYYLAKSPWRYKASLRKQNAVLIYGESTNNRNTLLPIIEELGGNAVIDLHSHGQYPKWRLYWYAIPHLWSFVREIKKNPAEKRDTIKHFFPKFWVMYGCNKAAGQLLDFYRPRVLVLANDHLYFHRSLMHEANKRGIPTIYVQHAAITDKFPPLGFSYSLLDGEDSYLKYKKKEGTQGNIYLSGGIRFDAIGKEEKIVPTTKTLGVAINLVDDEKLVKDCCTRLKSTSSEKNPIDVVLRLHPQMNLEEWSEWCEKNGIGFSNARKESSFAFLNRISLLVSNQSSIHLDAAMCHVPSVVYGLSNAAINDSYAFVKNGLVYKAENFGELAAFVEHSEKYIAPKEIVKYYNCSYGTGYEGRVARMMADLIKHISENNVKAFNEKYGFVLIDKTENRSLFKAE